MTALHLAAEEGHILVAEILLSYKAYVNAKSKEGLTPLHLAAQKGFPELVKMLIRQHGATIDALTLVFYLNVILIRFIYLCFSTRKPLYI